jgi:hypothetical protein
MSFFYTLFDGNIDQVFLDCCHKRNMGTDIVKAFSTWQFVLFSFTSDGLMTETRRRDCVEESTYKIDV